jgi:SAM-dependent methyltransferase
VPPDGKAATWSRPATYLEVLGEPEADEIAAWSALLRGPRVLSLGCGPARVENHLASAGYAVTGFDASPQMIAAARERDPAGDYKVGLFESPPALEGPFDAAMSGLLSLSEVHRRADLVDLLRWTRERLRPDAPVILEMAVAHHPARLAGLSESWEDPGGGRAFTLAYQRVVFRAADRARLSTTMTFRAGGVVDEHPGRELTVWTPRGIAGVLREAGGLAPPRFAPPYDAAELVATPPGDCLRALVVTRVTG